jgi:DNA-binding NtrC family response regulator
MTDPRILVVDDEEIARQNLLHVLGREGYAVDCAATAEEALGALEKAEYQLVLTDLRMPGMDGLSLLRRIKERQQATEVIVITAHASTESAVEAMRAGAFFYIEKPFRLADVRKIVQEAFEKSALKIENRALKRALSNSAGPHRIIANSLAMDDVLSTVARVAPTECSVLIHGETGTGKELVARQVHALSLRAAKPFVAVNCGVLSDELLANELFGHERGAFTGAAATKTGLIEAAEGGTLFLDEVTEMSPLIQVKLLRFLQEREYLRVGGVQPRKADIRIVAATNREPELEVAAGRLRQDLYFRLNVVGIRMPPLREHKEDLPILISHFMERFAARMGKAAPRLSPEVLDCLLAHDFPGNIRELENVIERAMALSGGALIEVGALPANLRAGGNRAAPGAPVEPLPTLAQLEKEHIMKVLSRCDGNRAQAAKILGIDRVSLWRKLRGYSDFKGAAEHVSSAVEAP